MMMKINDDLLRHIESDLSLNAPYNKGKINPVKNCWHFYSSGNAVDALFYDKDDFIDGMNRVFTVCEKHSVIILAFCLMDTHVHFILYGEYDHCNKFMHNYMYHTSIRISKRHNERHKLLRIPISHQVIDNESYLKSVICYVIKNAPVGGLKYSSYDYPWSSGGLYFRDSNPWYAPIWTKICGQSNMSELAKSESSKIDDFCSIFKSTHLNKLNTREKRILFKSKIINYRDNILIIDGVIFPGEYVAYEIVERIFKTNRSFNYFMCKTKEEDIEKQGGILSELSIPIQELRQHRNKICKNLFETDSIRNLTPQQRIKLARAIKSQLNCSPKQICRLCGLIYTEIKDLL